MFVAQFFASHQLLLVYELLHSLLAQTVVVLVFVGNQCFFATLNDAHTREAFLLDLGNDAFAVAGDEYAFAFLQTSLHRIALTLGFIHLSNALFFGSKYDSFLRTHLLLCYGTLGGIGGGLDLLQFGQTFL